MSNRQRSKNPPRDGRADNGGARQPTAGTAYTNRSDLQAAPVRTAPGQTYGQGAAQAAAQKAVPMAGGPAPIPAPAATPGGTGGPPPGSFGDFLRPTERPGEPLTHGAPVGPGAGPEAMAMNANGAGSNDDAVDLESFGRYLPELELMANLPGTSVAARNFIRRLRGASAG